MAKLTELAAMQHGNYLKKTEAYFDFINDCYSAGDQHCAELESITVTGKENKLAFLALVTLCLLRGRGAWSHIEQYEHRFGSEYLIAVELHLGILLKGLNSPRGGAVLANITDIRLSLVENLKVILNELRSKNQQNKTLPDFIESLFEVKRDKSLLEPMTIAMVVDDLNPQPTATLTKMMFDLIAVMLEFTPHKILIVCSRLHAPADQFWTPGVHQTRLISLREYLDHFDIPVPAEADRVSMINLNEFFYGHQKHDRIKIDAFVTYPFRHGILEPILYARAPVVEIEIMSGMSNATNCDMVVPNGVPSESFLKSHLAKTGITQPPIRKFKGGKGSSFAYLSGVDRFIVCASKDFDKRAELDISEFLEYVSRFLAKNAGFSWVFVGGSKDFENFLQKNYSELCDSKQIVYVGYEQDLPALLRLAYLYVHPPMVGGGRLPLIAIENGCPVITFQFGDCTMYIPYSCQYKNFETIFGAIDELARQKEKRDKMLLEYKSIFYPTVNMEAAISFECVLRRARVKYIGRTS